MIVCVREQCDCGCASSNVIVCVREQCDCGREGGSVIVGMGVAV